MTALPSPAHAPAIAEIVASTPGVVSLGAATAVTAATYRPGARVTGVRIHGGDVTIHLVADLAAPSLPALASAVRSRILARFPGTGDIDVTVDDLAAPAGPRAATGSGGPSVADDPPADAPATAPTIVIADGPGAPAPAAVYPRALAEAATALDDAATAIARAATRLAAAAAEDREAETSRLPSGPDATPVAALSL